MGKGAVSKRKAVGASHVRHSPVSTSAATKQSMSQFRDVKANPPTGFRKKQKSMILAGLRALGAPAVAFPEHLSNLSFSFPHQNQTPLVEIKCVPQTSCRLYPGHCVPCDAPLCTQGVAVLEGISLEPCRVLLRRPIGHDRRA